MALDKQYAFSPEVFSKIALRYPVTQALREKTSLLVTSFKTNPHLDQSPEATARHRAMVSSLLASENKTLSSAGIPLKNLSAACKTRPGLVMELSISASVRSAVSDLKQTVSLARLTS